MSRLKDVFRAGRLLPMLAGVAALALVAVVVVIATGGDEAAEPVAEPAAAERAKPADGDLRTGTGGSQSRKQREEAGSESKDQQPDPEKESPSPQPESTATDGGDDGQASGVSQAARGGKRSDKGKEDEISCAEREKATGGDPELERLLEQWMGPCE